MKRATHVLILILILLANGAAQILAQSSPVPKFEVSSIKLCQGGDRSPAPSSSPGRLSMPCWPLERLIQDAYEVFAAGKVDPLNPAFPLTPLEGFPREMAGSYSIEAKAETPESFAMMRGPMMQHLLEDRFHLKTHRETREVPVYIMTVAKGGSKLEPTKEGSCNHPDTSDMTQSERLPPGSKPWCAITPPAKNGAVFTWDVSGMTLDHFSKRLNIAGRKVIDKTGLTGVFDIHLEWVERDPSAPPPEADAASEPPNTAIVSAIRKQLGLQLDPGKGPREFLVIDHIEKLSAN